MKGKLKKAMDARLGVSGLNTASSSVVSKVGAVKAAAKKTGPPPKSQEQIELETITV
jgi:hypothetical protein